MEKKQFSLSEISRVSFCWAAAALVLRLLSVLLAGVITAPAAVLMRSGVVELLFMLAPLFIMAKKYRVDALAPLRLGRLAELWENPRALLIPVILAAVLGWCIYSPMDILQSLWLGLLDTLHIGSSLTQVPELTNGGLKLLAFLCLSFCPALCEELCIRGHLFPALGKKLPAITALWVSTLYFALMHGSFAALPYTFLMGWIMGWISLRTHSIYPGMAFHLFFNLRGINASQAVQEAAKMSQDTAAYQSYALMTNLTASIFALIVTVAALFVLRVLTAEEKQEAAPAGEEKEGKWKQALILAMALMAALTILSAFL